MAFRFLYLAFCAVLRLLVRRRGDAARDAEIVWAGVLEPAAIERATARMRVVFPDSTITSHRA